MIIVMEEHRFNNFRYREFDRNVLVTTDSGRWIFLSQVEFSKLRSERVDEGSDLFSKLVDVGIVLTKDNISKEIDKLRKRNIFSFTGTSLHIVIPTMKCNHRCVYCHAGASNCEGEDMSEEKARNVVDFIFKSPSKTITIEFQGGEPLLKFDLIKFIIEYAKKVNKEAGKDVLFTIVTNFSLMNEERMEFFIKNNVALCTSLDGPEELHNHNRKFAGGNSYEKVIGWIRRLQEEYFNRKITNTRVNALITITRKSLGYSKEIIDEYVSNGLMDFHLRFLNNLGDARETWNDICYSPEEFIEFWRRSMDYVIELNLSGQRIRENGSLIILRKLLSEYDSNYFEMRSPCGACIGQMAYTPNGDVFSCDEARMLNEDLFKIGNVCENSFKEVFSCDKTCAIVSSSVNDVQICDACAYKPYCGICPVCNYAEQGSLVAKVPETARCKIFMAQFDYLFEKLRDREIRAIFEGWMKDK